MLKMEIKEKLQVKIEELVKPPYCEILCYPRLEEREVAGRINELKSLGVKKLEFIGSKNAVSYTHLTLPTN